MYIIKCVKFILSICLFYLIVTLNQTNWTLAFRPQNIKTELTHFHIYSNGSCKKKAFLLDSTDCDQENATTTLVEDEITAEDYPKYNKYPSFCTGRFNFFELDLFKDKKLISKEIYPKFIAYLHLFTKLDFDLHRYGSFSISYKDQDKNNANEAVNPKHFYNSNKINTLDDDFDETSLIKIHTYGKEQFKDEGKEFLKQLDNQKIETYDVKDLITKTVPQKDVKLELRNSLQNQIINKYDLNSLYENIKPREWLYLPDKKILNINLFLEDISLPIHLSFRLYPGTRPLVIHKGCIFVPKQAPTNFNCDGSSTEIDLVCFTKVRPVVNYSTKKILSNDLSRSKIKLITISGSLRQRFNILFKILELLNANSPPYKLQDPIPLNNAVPSSCIKLPIHVKSLAVYLNSKFRFVIPLLTYFDNLTGMTHLCNHGTTFDFKPDRVWFPIRTGYGSFNKYFVPIQYRKAGFFSSNQIDFKPEVIFNMLSSYLSFWKLIEDHESKDLVDGNTCLKKTFEEVKESEKGDGENKEKRNYKVYYVGGKYKMIYKDEDGSIILNLLL
ncbi:putative integral membrane protein [Theileria parva strain Muguga]|uniref:putative integral membrane protein n=1 Tax=Theileria parva strain Muguga TaxID=333668 RepID=UPI001C617AB1|nr:putative integral membrane protein [Theileria parva strain Muguga]KAF5153332.1 putative integral membrane protein [Theileria parva strain Muguga]